MTATHVPVLLHETVDLLAPPRGGVAVDCTFGAGGHARLDRRAPRARRHCSSRSTAIPTRRRASTSSRPRSRARRGSSARDFVEGLASCADEDVRADPCYMDLGMSSMQVDTRERGFSYAYDAPLDMRMDPTQRAHARARSSTSGTSAASPARCATTARSATPARSPARSCAPRARRRSRRRRELVEAITAAVPAPARFAGGHPAKRTFQAIRIAVNDELGQLDAALPLAWRAAARRRPVCRDLLPILEDRRVKRFLVDLARGCICPPDLPVCVCGGEPRGGAAQPPRRSSPARPRSPRTRAPRRRGCAPPASSRTPNEPTGDRRAPRDARRPGARPAGVPRVRPAARLRARRATRPAAAAAAPRRSARRRRPSPARCPTRRAARPADPRARRGSLSSPSLLIGIVAHAGPHARPERRHRPRGREGHDARAAERHAAPGGLAPRRPATASQGRPSSSGSSCRTPVRSATLTSAADAAHAAKTMKPAPTRAQARRRRGRRGTGAIAGAERRDGAGRDARAATTDPARPQRRRGHDDRGGAAAATSRRRQTAQAQRSARRRAAAAGTVQAQAPAAAHQPVTGPDAGRRRRRDPGG